VRIPVAITISKIHPKEVQNRGEDAAVPVVSSVAVKVDTWPCTVVGLCAVAIGVRN
jgi:uncharacterized membrane protein